MCDEQMMIWIQFMIHSLLLQSFDINGDGFISPEELSRILCCKGYDKLTEDELSCVSNIYAHMTKIDSSHSLFLNSDQPWAILKFICDEDLLAVS